MTLHPGASEARFYPRSHSDGRWEARLRTDNGVSAGIALAASWSRLARRVREMMGKDARARGGHFRPGTGMNIYRAPMNGRNFEYLGEDLTSLAHGSFAD